MPLSQLLRSVTAPLPDVVPVVVFTGPRTGQRQLKQGVAHQSGGLECHDATYKWEIYTFIE